MLWTELNKWAACSLVSFLRDKGLLGKSSEDFCTRAGNPQEKGLSPVPHQNRHSSPSPSPTLGEHHVEAGGWLQPLCSAPPTHVSLMPDYCAVIWSSGTGDSPGFCSQSRLGHWAGSLWRFSERCLSCCGGLADEIIPLMVRNHDASVQRHLFDVYFSLNRFRLCLKCATMLWERNENKNWPHNLHRVDSIRINWNVATERHCKIVTTVCVCAVWRGEWEHWSVGEHPLSSPVLPADHHPEGGT